jgi:hypothetical protein
MMAAYRLRGLGWLASCAGIVLGFYLVSLQVASERNKLEALNGRIRTAERDIRALETEFDTRANLQQLERWNGDILALSAPVAGQFVSDERRLASVSFGRPLVADGEGPVRTAALVVPAMPALAAPPAAVDPIRTARIVEPAPAPKASAAIRVVQVAQAAVSAVKPRKVAMLDDGLLSDATFGDIVSRARSEAGRR